MILVNDATQFIAFCKLVPDVKFEIWAADIISILPPTKPHLGYQRNTAAFSIILLVGAPECQNVDI